MSVSPIIQDGKLVSSIILDELKTKGLKNIALIGKTVEDCKNLSEALQDYNHIHIIDDKDSEYNGGISIVPSYLSKGLEFDAVIVSNASSEFYSEHERNLLYVVLTRALHKLEIYYSGNLTNLISGANDER